MALVIDRGKAASTGAAEDDAKPEIVMLNVSNQPESKPRIKPGSAIGKDGKGRVGFQSGKGEGSGATPKLARGGGGGGDGRPSASSSWQTPAAVIDSGSHPESAADSSAESSRSRHKHRSRALERSQSSRLWRSAFRIRTFLQMDQAPAVAWAQIEDSESAQATVTDDGPGKHKNMGGRRRRAWLLRTGRRLTVPIERYADQKSNKERGF